MNNIEKCVQERLDYMVTILGSIVNINGGGGLEMTI